MMIAPAATSGITHWIVEMGRFHPYLLGMIGSIVTALLNAAITSLPSPDAQSGKFYRWFFTFAHAAILAIPRLVAQYRNGAPEGKPNG
jgi:hypothetical protein